MAGKICTSGAAVVIFAVFSGAAAPAQWASATPSSGIHYAVPPGGASLARARMQ
jgi:hypothetical protein